MKKQILYLALCIIPFTASAWIPVFDVASFSKLAEQFEQMQQQFQVLQKTYNNAQQELQQMKQLVEVTQGHYGMGNLLNSADHLKVWQTTYLQDPLHKLGGAEDYYKRHPSLSFSEYQRGSSKLRAKLYRQRVQVNQSVTVNASHSYQQLATYLKRIYQLSNNIEHADTLKQAIDLNNRLLVEMAYLQLQQLKIQTLVLHQHAGEVAGQIDQATWSANFNQWHPFTATAEQP